ncbi:MAG: transglycosylase domain-containing protein, partial [Nocardioidaceae bacterium]
SKEEILQGYLNTIYFGRGAYGIEAAAHAYFDKPASKLNLREGAVLASILNSPGTMDPAIEKDNAEELLARYRYVLDGMAESGAIDGKKAAKASRKLPKLAEYEVTDTLGGPKGYLLRLVEEHMASEGFTEDQIYGGGLKVVTTFDYKAQQATRRAVNQIRPKGLKNLHVGISSVEPGTGALRAMYGGQDYVESQYNWAEAGGQPGSTFKPFGLAAGFRNGFTMNTYFDGDSPYDLPLSGEVENQGNKDYGPVSLRTATTRSINTAYVDMTLQMEDGPKKVIRAAEDAGVKEDSEDPLSPSGVVALGPQTVSVTEMAEGYATFAANGEQADWYVLEEVTDDGGQVRYQHKEETERAFSRTVASNVTAAMQHVVRDQHGTGFDSLNDFGRPAAGKTGTATSEGGIVSSSWFVGYTPQLSTAVMYVRGDGNNELRGYLNPFYGGWYPAKTWEAAMIGALQGKPILGFPQPGHLIEEEESTVSPEPTFTPTPTTEEPTTEEPSPTPSETSEEPSPTPTPSETSEEPTPSPSPSSEPSPSTTCDLIPPNCKDESKSPKSSNGNGGGLGQGGGD